MKTIKQKAEAYDEAIKVIKNNLGALNEIAETGAEVVNIQSIRNCFYRAFPELKESEDEKIRKEILDYIDKATGCKRWIAWLEKQGQVKESLISQHENKMCKESDDSLTSEDERIRKDLIGFFKDSGFIYHKKEEIVEWLEKQGKNSSNIGNDGKIADIIREALANVTSQNVLGKYELTFDDVSDWLDGQPADKKELKKIEPAWSEEDEWKFSDILALLRGGENCHYNTPDLFDWLKSIKDRKNWKPSDEQIEALESATENCAYSEYQDCLKELIAELKKLKE